MLDPEWYFIPAAPSGDADRGRPIPLPRRFTRESLDGGCVLFRLVPATAADRVQKGGNLAANTLQESP